MADNSPNVAASRSGLEIHGEVRRRRYVRAIDILNRERQKRADHQSDDHRGNRDGHDLQKVDEKNQRSIRTEGFKRRDVLALAVEECRHRLRRADAADCKRGEADKREEHRDLFDEAFDARRRVVAVANIPSAIGEGRSRLRLEVLDGRIRRQHHVIIVIDQASEDDESGSLQGGVADEDMRTKAEAARDAIRLAVEHGS